jgi:antibiotic biosynthesis monooxygenase (ABM) superfamily enzyme
MVIYEVNVTVEVQIQSAFRDWLRGHVREILNLPGFISAHLFSAEAGSAGAATIQYMVQFEVESRDSLQSYFQTSASNMRQIMIDRFGDRVTSHRRILLPL